MNSEKGFILPLTLITITILFLVLSTLVLRFEKEIIMTHNIQEQYIFESLFSLAINEKEVDITKNTAFPPTTTFDYDQGHVTISYTAFHSHFRIQFLITLNNGKQYTVYQAFSWAEDDRLDSKN